MGRAGKRSVRVRMEHDQALRFRLPGSASNRPTIGFVIITHLHIDHASAVLRVPPGDVRDRRREWEAAAAGGTRQGYHQRQFDHAFDWRTVDYSSPAVESFAGFGRTLDLFGDGAVRLISTPGHTPGHQSVLLRTAQGEVLLAGDAAYTEGELRGHDRPLVVADEHLRRRSIREIEQFRRQTPDAVVILSHDWQLWPQLRSVYG